MSRARPRVRLDAVKKDAGAVTACVRVDGLAEPVDVRSRGDDTYRVSIDGHGFEVMVARGPDADWGWVEGRIFRWPRGQRSDPPPTPDDGASGPADAPLAATTPATVIAVRVAAGQTVARGDTLLVLEAMKMQIPLRAPRDGRVTAVRCREGDQVEAGVPLVELVD